MKKRLLKSMFFFACMVMGPTISSAQTYSLDLTLNLDTSLPPTYYYTTISVENSAGETIYTSEEIPFTEFDFEKLITWNNVISVSPGTYTIKTFIYSSYQYRTLERADTVDIVDNSSYIAEFSGGFPLKWVWVYFWDANNYIQFV